MKIYVTCRVGETIKYLREGWPMWTAVRKDAKVYKSRAAADRDRDAARRLLRGMPYHVGTLQV